MRNWIERNTVLISAFSAMATAIVGIVALVAVKAQIDASDGQQRAQSAREIYREFLNISIQKPQLAIADFCKIQTAAEKSAYLSYMDYMLYTAEQLISIDVEWEQPMQALLSEHSHYFCQKDNWNEYTPAVVMLGENMLQTCPQPPTC
ncbi:hypothetical protein [Maritalea sp.]|uniref:hypothetical protein n=1 Tax=Maritalea sp. TaxID=2003361 RepID=UPI003F4AF687